MDYADLQTTAQRLIREFGRDVVLRHVSVTGGHPYDPGSGTETIVDTQVRLVVLPEGWREADIAGTLIRIDDLHAYMGTEGLSVTPNRGDHIVMDGHEFEVIEVRRVKPADVVIYYDLALRR